MTARSGLSQVFLAEAEPNDAFATATPIAGTSAVVRSSIFVAADGDFYSFQANAGDRVYLATMTSGSTNASSNSVLDLFASDGVTVLETDDEDGVFSANASTIAGKVLPTAGTYYVRVKASTATALIRPYDLHFQLRSGAPVAETEPNEDALTANVIASGYASGTVSSALDVDFYAVTLNAGDTIFASLDLDPERDLVEWNGTLGIGLFNNQLLVANDAGVLTPDSEAHFMTVKTAGTYHIAVAAAALAVLPPGGGTYELSITVRPAEVPLGTCTTYTSTDVPIAIGPAAGLVASTITIPGNPRIADVDIALNLTHALMTDLDVHIVTPAGNDNGLFTDIGALAEPNMDLVLDDQAALPINAFTVMQGMAYQPELSYRLGWLNGEDAGGVWRLDIRDDATNNAGTLNGWSITICEPPPLPTCPAGTTPVTRYASDFEADDGGFTHAGTADEWQRGLPSLAPITTCNSGTSCWKTDLAGTYNASSAQDLVSPSISLANLVGPIRVAWAHRYQMESASFDHYSVDVVGATTRRVFQHAEATMTDSSIGSPSVTIEESAGWGLQGADISAFAGQSVALQFHVDTDTTVQKSGVAVDDVKVTGCALPFCGDGSVNVAGEICDDGNTNEGDGCDTNCTVTACGNGIASIGEGCDDGNLVSADGCDANCTVTACGNGILTLGEVCDDGDAVDGDGCDSNCTVTACGNAIVTLGEGCDDGNLASGDGCDANCTITACGNGVTTLGEACDDGNSNEGDGCDTNCTVTACGNAIVTLGEGCDDGNAIEGDGCDTNCTLTACGNGIVTLGEGCDDGNAIEADGCDTNCTLTACGNGVVAGTEVCDDGNAVDDDGCDTNCTLTACGNGVVAGTEDCDDGNAVDDDGCDTNCTVTACGNGVVAGTEACDDGNVVDDDGCDSNCTDTGCGNGVLAGTEACDDGNAIDADGCDSNCTLTACGNGVVTGTEACDDGNVVDDDGCDSNCTASGCGNGVVAGTEACDDGNDVDDDGCDSNCTDTACGNGVVTGDEACDDGNTTAGDGCNADCETEGGGGAGGGATTTTTTTTSSSTTGAGGDATSGGNGDETNPEGGCSCSVPGTQAEAGTSPWSAVAALLALGLLRRRKTGAAAR